MNRIFTSPVGAPPDIDAPFPFRWWRQHKIESAQGKITLRRITGALLAALVLSAVSNLRASTITAASCGANDVQAALSRAVAGDTVNIPAGTCHWTTPVSWTAPANVTLRGAGSLSLVGGGDATVIVDDYTVNAILLAITVNASGTFRMAGLTIQGGTGGVKDPGLINFYGPGTVRLDHVHLNAQTYTTPGGGQHSMMVKITNGIYGVLDHSLLDWSAASAIYIFNGEGPDGNGNAAWAANTDFGQSNFFFIEDNTLNGDVRTITSRVSDCYTAGRVVVRYNTLGYVGGPEPHATGHAGDGRGCRATENYGNHFTRIAGEDSSVSYEAYAMHDASSGPALIWGNTVDTAAIKNIILFNVTRKDTATYPSMPPPNRFGYCGAVPLQTGTVNVTGTAVTKATGSNFSTSWPSGTMIYIAGATCTAVTGQNQPNQATCGIASVNSTGSITLTNGGHTGSALTGASYTVGSIWDGNTDALGYPCLDQPGRGKSDLLTGVFPSKVDNATGTATWPNQALEPVYVWANVGSPNGNEGGVYYSNASGGRVVADRDYYAQASGIQTNAATPFNGSTGTGWGRRADRPTTCTRGVAYWSTDQGANWNTTNLTANDGTLDVCTATNTWTNAVYTPYTYPHPLTAQSQSAPATPTNVRIAS